jgi:hypothetical protein
MFQMIQTFPSWRTLRIDVLVERSFLRRLREEELPQTFSRFPFTESWKQDTTSSGLAPMIMTPRRTKALSGKTIGQIFLEDPEEVRENYCFLLLIQGLGRLSHSLGGELRMESSDRRASKSFVTGFVIELFRLVDEIGTGYKRLSVVLELGRKRDAG